MWFAIICELSLFLPIFRIRCEACLLLFLKMNVSVKILISFLFFCGHLFFLSAQAQTEQRKTTFTVTLDAGHGGHDPGAIGAISREKNITLAVIKKIGKRISEENQDIKVVYTRDVDKYITLQGRADIANKAKSDLFVSVHVNANNNREVSGCETYTLGLHKTQSNLDVAMRENSVILLEDNYNTKYAGFNPKSIDSYIMFECIQDRYVDKSVWLASEIEKNFASRNRRDRGVRQAGFWVLHKTAMPAILVEIGYITNAEEERFLNTEDGQQKIADAIYEALLKFKREYEIKSGTQKIVVPAKNEPVAAKQDSVAEQPKATQKKAEEKAAKIKRDEKKEAVNKSVEAFKEAKKKEKEEIEKAAQKKKEAEVKKTQEEKVEKVEKTKVEKAKDVNNDEVEFRLQLSALTKSIPLNSSAFKGLSVDVYQEGGYYKYTYGKTASYDEIVRLKNRISDKFPNAMIIAFMGGRKVSVAEARKNQK